jgi:hypothetical protein
MLDVHPPHEPIHGLRDFLLHLFTITIGLLIALSLEAAVEAAHHRHLVHQARETIREEITANQQTLALDRRGLDSNEVYLRHTIDQLNAYAKNPRQTPPHVAFPWMWDSPTGAAWHTARDTGALSLVPYDEVQRYTTLYGQQDMVNQQARVYIEHQNNAGIPLVIHPDLAGLTPAQLETLIENCATSLNDIHYTQALMQSLDRNYTDALQQK